MTKNCGLRLGVAININPGRRARPPQADPPVAERSRPIRHAPAFPINVSRGCTYQCSYCPYRVMTRSVRSRSVATVIDELVYLFYISGYPEDDVDSLRHTLAYAKKLNTYSAVFFVYTPLPDTPDADRHGATLTKPWECMDGYSLTYLHNHMTDTQVSAWVEKCFTEYSSGRIMLPSMYGSDIFGPSIDPLTE